MTRDPIVQEVRALREQHAARFNFDLEAIFADLKRTESRRKSVLLQPPLDASPASALRRTRHSRLRGARVAPRQTGTP